MEAQANKLTSQRIMMKNSKMIDALYKELTPRMHQFLIENNYPTKDYKYIFPKAISIVKIEMEREPERTEWKDRVYEVCCNVMKNILPDDVIIDAIINNKNKAIRQFLENMTPSIRVHVGMNSGNARDCEILVIETYIKVRRKLMKSDFKSDNVKGYFYRTAYYTWLEELRKKKKERTSEFNDSIYLNEKSIEKHQVRIIAEDSPRLNLLIKAKKSLSKNCRAIIELRFQGTDKSNTQFKDIAEELGDADENTTKEEMAVITGKLRTRFNRCMNRLKDIIKSFK